MEIVGVPSVEYIEDCLRIQAICQKNGHFDCTLAQEESLRILYSDSMCAWWMFLPEDDEMLFSCISAYIK